MKLFGIVNKVLLTLLVICIVGFVRIFFDSMDIDSLGGFRINRSLFLNYLAPNILLPVCGVLFTIWMHTKAIALKQYRKSNRYSKSLKYLHPIIWWIPIVHFCGSILSMKVMKNDAEQALDATNYKRLKSGVRWVNTAFVLFLTLVFIAAGFDFFNSNKDSHDFFLNVLFLFLISLLMGWIKVHKVLNSQEMNKKNSSKD